MRLGFALTLALLLEVACGSKRFTSATPSAAPSASTEDQEREMPASPSAKPEGCAADTSALAQIKLLSEGLSKQSRDQHVRYELVLVSCKDGSIQSIKDKPILFDLNVILNPFDTPISYSVLSGRDQRILASGELDALTGQDLFGNQGLYSYWRAPSFSYDNSEASLILDIHIKDIGLSPRQEGETMAESFLKISPLPPVKLLLKWLD